MPDTAIPIGPHIAEQIPNRVTVDPNMPITTPDYASKIGGLVSSQTQSSANNQSNSSGSYPPNPGNNPTTSQIPWLHVFVWGLVGAGIGAVVAVSTEQGKKSSRSHSSS